MKKFIFLYKKPSTGAQVHKKEIEASDEEDAKNEWQSFIRDSVERLEDVTNKFSEDTEHIET